MNTNNLPPLPEPLIQHKATFATITGYTAEQMREYGQLCRQQMKEEAAKEFDRRAEPMVGWYEPNEPAFIIRSLK